MRAIIITAANAGGRLDKIIFRYLDKASSGFVYKMLRKKNITLNDHRAGGGEIVKEGDSVKMYLSEETIARFKSGMSVREAAVDKRPNERPTRSDRNRALTSLTRSITSLNLKEQIVFEDQNLLAINKPSGLLSQKARPDDLSVNDFLLQYIPGDEIFKPGISNRLDRNTSGILLAGKNLAASRELNHAIMTRGLSKQYLSIVKGRIEEAGRLSSWLVKEESTNKVKVYAEKPSDKAAQKIETVYEPLTCSDEMTLLKVDLITGKPHQIRAHLAFIGHPVGGDTKYGDPVWNSSLKERYGACHQLLHAWKIVFTEMDGVLWYLNGTVILAPPPVLMQQIIRSEFNIGSELWQHGARAD